MELLEGMRRPTEAELKEYLLYVLKETDKPARTREETREAWEKGWAENLKSGDTKPGYFRGSKFLRYGGEIVVCDDPQTEHKLFVKTRDEVFRKHLTGFKDIYEVGCGSCQNLDAMREIFPLATLHGLDSSPTAVEIANQRGYSGRLYDMTNPDGIKFGPDSAVVTVHAMEQIGGIRDGRHYCTEYAEFFRVLLLDKPGIVVHIEPIYEFYDPSDLFDYAAMRYHDKRGYLRGYYPDLRYWEKEYPGEIEIIEARRPHVGGVLHEASIIVWRPK